MKRFTFILLLLLTFVIICSITVAAHPGRTDEYGGHWDHSTGEYHYHGEPDSSHSGGSSSGNTTNRDWGNSGTSSGSSSSSNGLDSDEIFDIIIICVTFGPFVLFVLWVLVISPIIDKINEFFHPLPKELPTTETPTQPHEDPPVPSSAEQKQSAPTVPSHKKIQGSESIPFKTVTPPSSQKKSPSTPPKTRPTPTIHYRGSENAYTPATPQKQPTCEAQSAAVTALPTCKQAITSFPNWLLDINSDYFTKAQQQQFIAMLDASRVKRAITEHFSFKNLHIDETSTPHRVSASVTSFNSSQAYITTFTRCSCPDNRARHLPCKHMIALAIHVNAITVDAEALQNSKKGADPHALIRKK